MFQPLSMSANDPKFYASLAQELEAMMTGLWYSDLSNASALIMSSVADLNWAGFYLFNDDRLWLGPFQGMPACLQIPLHKGVCGKAARERQAVRVDDVHQFPGHIACDANSRSELVLPLIKDGRLVGVLDLDSPKVGRFSSSDEAGFTILAEILQRKVHWPDRFQ